MVDRVIEEVKNSFVLDRSDERIVSVTDKKIITKTGNYVYLSSKQNIFVGRLTYDLEPNTDSKPKGIERFYVYDVTSKTEFEIIGVVTIYSYNPVKFIISEVNQYEVNFDNIFSGQRVWYGLFITIEPAIFYHIEENEGEQLGAKDRYENCDYSGIICVYLDNEPARIEHRLNGQLHGTLITYINEDDPFDKERVIIEYDHGIIVKTTIYEYDYYSKELEHKISVIGENVEWYDFHGTKHLFAEGKVKRTKNEFVNFDDYYELFNRIYSKCGLWTYYNDNGDIFMKGRYANNARIGKWKSFCCDGSLCWKGSYAQTSSGDKHISCIDLNRIYDESYPRFGKWVVTSFDTGTTIAYFINNIPIGQKISSCHGFIKDEPIDPEDDDFRTTVLNEIDQMGMCIGGSELIDDRTDLPDECFEDWIIVESIKPYDT